MDTDLAYLHTHHFGDCPGDVMLDLPADLANVYAAFKRNVNISRDFIVLYLDLHPVLGEVCV